MKQFKRWVALSLTALLLCGCGKVQEQEIPAVNTISVTDASEGENALPIPETFQNANGTAQFHVNIQETGDFDGMEVLEVQPHYLTLEDAKKIVYTLFPEANCIERGAEYDKPDWYFTRETLEASLERWKSYLQGDFLEELLGMDALAVGDMDESGKEYTYIETYEESLAYYEETLKRLPEGDARPACRWTMRKESEYHYPAEECARMDLRDDRNAMEAIIETEECEYYFHVGVQKEGEHKWNQIYLSLYGGLSPMDIDTYVQRAKYWRTSEPTEAQVENAKALALQYIESFGWGDWEVTRAMVQNLNEGGTPEYLISLEAVPKGELPGVENRAVINAPETESVAYFTFNADGFLDGFNIHFPTQEVHTLEESPALLSMEQLTESAITYLSRSKDRAFGYSEEILADWDKGYDIKTQTVVEITKARPGYAVHETGDGETVCIPALVLYGDVSFRDLLGSQPEIYTLPHQAHPEGETPILAVNALNGSVITLY